MGKLISEEFFGLGELTLYFARYALLQHLIDVNAVLS